MKTLIGNRVTEKDIRDWLNLNGFQGKLAKISSLELFAIARPGWKQLFSFDLIAKIGPAKKMNDSPMDRDTSSEKRYWGVVLDDERIKNLEQRTQVWLFDTSEEQQSKLAESSIGMTARNRNTNAQPLIFLMIGAAIFLGVVFLVSCFF